MIKVERLENCNIERVLYEDSPSFSGIVAGECRGQLWVDDIENPQLAMAFSFAVGGFSILGEPREEVVYRQFYNFLILDFFPKLREMNQYYFEFSTECIRMQEYMLKMFTNRKIESENEYFYRKETKIETKVQIPDEYIIVKVDAKFIAKLERGEYINRKFLEERLLESWGSYSNFLNKSVAFVIHHQKRIVAVIIGTARFHNIIPIDIETVEQHRKKKMASALTQCFVNECVDNQLVTQWDCVDSNIASKKTAEKSGFLLMKKKPYYWFNI